MKGLVLYLLPLALSFAAACGRLEKETEEPAADPEETIGLQDVALMLSSVGIALEQVGEVHDAVSESDANGYDNEYLMKDLFSSPGTGVGADRVKSSTGGKDYRLPLRDLITRYLNNGTKSGGISAEEYLNIICSGDMQIYWPYSGNWDGTTLPVITYDPLGSATSNYGYRLTADGGVEEVLVTEELARQSPVWVVNRNDDASYETLEVLRKNHPEWEEGGSISVKTKAVLENDGDAKTLVLKDMTALSNYDSFFAGGSEFFIKIGAVESFTASTEAEMYLYNPEVTDFMVKVKRSEVGKVKTLNTLLISQWTQQLDNIAFMIIEDDGGTQTSWKCSALVKLKSKSYGIEIEIPYHSRDDIVWRGQMSRKYIEKSSNVTGYFGDVLLTFEVK